GGGQCGDYARVAPQGTCKSAARAPRRCLEPSTSEQTPDYGRDRRKPNSTVATCPWTVVCSEFLAGKMRTKRPPLQDNRVKPRAAAGLNARQPAVRHIRSVRQLSRQRFLPKETVSYVGPEIVEEHEDNCDNPAVNATRDQPIDEACERQQSEVRENRGQ